MRTRPLAILLLTLLLAPSVGARWSAYGSHEPDTTRDTGSYMWQDPPGAERDRVYFNVVTTFAYTSVNPNIGLLGTSQETFLTEYHEAMLGRWIDCNGDGYVGMAETLVREYSARLLLDDSRCPSATGPPGSWSTDANYNGWVTELTPLAPIRGSSGDDRVFRMEGVQIWGDHGFPDGPVQVASCALQRFPPGGARSTGRILDHADCLSSIMIGRETADDNDLVADTLAGAGAEGVPRTRGTWVGHALDRPTFGEDEAGTYFHAFDCEDDRQRIYLTDPSPPGHDLDNRYVRPLAVPNLDSVSPSGSVAGTYLYYSRTVAGGGNADPCHGARWHPKDDSLYSILEGDAYDVTIGVKDHANWQFRYRTNERGTGLARPISPGDAGASSDLGVSPLWRGLAPIAPQIGSGATIPSGWYADTPNLRKVPAIVRIDLAEPVDMFPPYQNFSFYAYAPHLDSLNLRTPSGNHLFVYGAGACEEATSGIHNGWQCDPDLWYASPPPGWRPAFPVAELPRVGSLYHLRDVDCHDGGNDIGLQTGLAAYGPRPCPRPPHTLLGPLGT